MSFWHFYLCRGFCHRTESDLFLFLYILATDVNAVITLFVIITTFCPVTTNIICFHPIWVTGGNGPLKVEFFSARTARGRSRTCDIYSWIGPSFDKHEIGWLQQEILCLAMTWKHVGRSVVVVWCCKGQWWVSADNWLAKPLLFVRL